jgi:hypothetical protein
MMDPAADKNRLAPRHAKSPGPKISRRDPVPEGSACETLTFRNTHTIPESGLRPFRQSPDQCEALSRHCQDIVWVSIMPVNIREVADEDRVEDGEVFRHNPESEYRDW